MKNDHIRRVVRTLLQAVSAAIGALALWVVNPDNGREALILMAGAALPVIASGLQNMAEYLKDKEPVPPLIRP